MTVGVGVDGRALVHCFSRNCSESAICEAIGLTTADLFVRNGSPKRATGSKSAKPKTVYPTRDDAISTAVRFVENGTYAAQWDYCRADDSLAFVVIRVNEPDGKQFRPIHPTGDGWVIGAPTGPFPLFGLTTLANAELVIVTEGERCAATARTLGYVATTSAFGSKSAAKTDWSALAGKQVVILPDSDGPGRDYAATVAKILTGLTPPASVKVVTLLDLPAGGDICDFVDALDSKSNEDIRMGIDELIAATPWFVPQADTAKPQAKPVRDVPEWEPFPLDTLPVEIREPIRVVARAMSVDPSMIALPLLVVFAGAIGNSRRLQIKRGWYAPAILWAVIVAESGEVKTPAIQFAGRILFRRYKRAIREFAETQKRYEAELAEYNVKRKTEGDNCTMRKPKAPTLARCIISDATIEAIAVIHDENPRGLTLVRDELAAWLGSFNQYRSKGRGADIQHWEELHSGIGMIVDRKGVSGAPRQTTCIPRAAISITGGVQPGTLARILTPEFFESGLVARILFTMPAPKLRQWVNEEMPDGVEDQFDRIADRLFELQLEGDRDGEPQPKLLRFTDAALAKYIDFHNEHCREQFGLHGDLKACWSKLEGYAARLALTLHLVRWAAGELVDPDFVNGEGVDNAVRLVRWFANEDRRVYGMMSEGFAGKEDRELAALIESR
ncbi:MAG: DUF3987 domain-containing protein, partial [Phycisphaerales bacterium]|nr:DUF3987 domain-containing protein [Phycisphaerales bacterium]